jgi:hypothetical protein
MIIDNRCFKIIMNEISINFSDCIAVIKPHFCNNGVMMWCIIFYKIKGLRKESKPIYYNTLEESLRFVNQYCEQSKYSQILKDLYK